MRRSHPIFLTQKITYSSVVSKPERTYSTREVAQHLGVSVQTIQRWVDAGQLKAWKTVGGHRRIDLASAQALMQRSGGGAPSALPTPTKAPYVLLLDGDDTHRKLLAREVGTALPGARVEQATDAFSALLSMGARMPDVLIVDLSLADVDGLAMLQHLATRAKVAPARMLVLSAGHRHDLPVGVTSLRKPVDVDLLHRTLRGDVAAVAAP